MKKNLIKKILLAIFILMCSTFILGSLFVKKLFPDVAFEELYFYLTNGVESSDNSLFILGLKNCLILIIIFSIMIYFIIDKMYITNIILKKKKNLLKIFKIVYLNLFLILSLYILAYNLNFFKYLKDQASISELIEKRYVDPRKVDVKFPLKKNLIMIYVESLETSLFTKEQGGYWDYSVIGELYDLLNDSDSTVFYQSNKAQSMEMLDTSAWTTASVVANSSGLPFKIPIKRNSYHSNNFMDGAYALGDLLKDNGYYNELISSARTSFGGIKEYFKRHGNFKIIDINSYANFDLQITKDDMCKWGFNDKFLFDSAKKRLNVIKNMDKPFNLVLQTIDTHYVDGYIGNYSVNKYDTRYENVYATESKLIVNFINWVKKQDFYKDTTIVIVGDHLSMQTSYFESRGANKRYVYNCYINSAIKKSNTSNRIYTALDTYPTILSSIGAIVDGDKLGLGTNLFSDKKTLDEEYGFDKLNKELNKKSVFYNKKILKKDYDDMIKEKS